MRDCDEDLALLWVIDAVVSGVDCPNSGSRAFIFLREAAVDFGGDLIDLYEGCSLVTDL